MQGRDPDSDRSLRYRATAGVLIAAVALLRIAYLGWFCPLDLATDEAHYWDWSRQLDWCYYSKGPLIAWLIRASCELFGNTVLAVRLPAVLCGSLLLVGLYTLTLQVYRSDKLALVVILLAQTLPIIAAGSSLMTIDAPFTCAWMWALVFGYRAMFADARWAWFTAGVCIALGVLAKHTMVLWVVSFFLFLVTTPILRGLLRQSGFWCMLGLGALGVVPIVAWNWAHGWVTLLHTQEHAGVSEGLSFRWHGPLQYVAVQFAVLLGLWFLVWARAMWTHRPTVETRPELRYLWWMSAPTFVFFGGFALLNGGGGPNWPIVCYLAGLVLAAGEVGPMLFTSNARRVGLAGVVVLGLSITLILHDPAPVQPMLLQLAGPATKQHPTPIRRLDPTSRLRGWNYLAAEVDRERLKLNWRGIEPVLAAERWTHASELAFYCEGQPAVHCLGVLCQDRSSQYDLWRPNPVADPADFRDRTFILVGTDLELLRRAFTALEPIRTITYDEDGQPIARWQVAVAHGYRGR